MKTAIIAVAYNRTNSLKRLLKSLECADYPEPATLIISIDKSRTDAVERFANEYHWPHGDLRIVRHEKNLGLRAHMLSLGQYFDEFDALIVLEDDTTVATSYYYYAKACVEKYANDERIAGISLYSYQINYQTYMPFTPAKSKYDVYLMNCAMSWGQVWMKKQWQQFMKWYEKNSEEFNLPHLPSSINNWPKSSWLKYHIRYCIEQNLYFVFPYYSLSTNNADPGVNFNYIDSMFQANMLVGVQTKFHLPEYNQAIIRYDGFYQAKFLSRHLMIAEEELCVDLFCNKPSCLYKHYLLSNRPHPYKVIKSFALQLRPIELNIIYQREGNELWLYDTTQKAQPPKTPDHYLAYVYFYQKGFYKARTMIGVGRSIRLLAKLVTDKLKSLYLNKKNKYFH